MPPYRLESDHLGEIRVPADAYYGAHTQRALDLLPRLGISIPRRLIWAIGLVKRSTAEANEELELLDVGRAEWIATAAQEVMDGRHDPHFLIEIFESGSGAALHNNASEVIANRAIEMMGGDMGSRAPIHPADHVCMGQSPNDVMPSSIQIAAAVGLNIELLPALTRLLGALDRKATEFESIVKVGRPHLVSTAPMTLGQEVSGWTSQVAQAVRRAESARDALLALPLGGTTVGTGFGCHEGFAANAIARIADECELPFHEAQNHFAAQSCGDALVEASGHLRTIATGLLKIGQEARVLSSDLSGVPPQLSLGRAAPQPAFVSPFPVSGLCEMLMMVAAQVIGNDAALTVAGTTMSPQVNTMLPVMARNLLESISLMSAACTSFEAGFVSCLEANEAGCRDAVDSGSVMLAALLPQLGQETTARIASIIAETQQSIRAVVVAETDLSPAEVDRLLDPDATATGS